MKLALSDWMSTVIHIISLINKEDETAKTGQWSGAGPFSRCSCLQDFMTDDFKEKAPHWSYNKGILGKSKEFQRTLVLFHLQIRKMKSTEGKWLNQGHTVRWGGSLGIPFYYPVLYPWAPSSSPAADINMISWGNLSEDWRTHLAF